MSEDKENIVYVCNCAMHIDNEYFSQAQAVPEEVLTPLFVALRKKCGGKIDAVGDYKFEIKIIRLK